MNASIKTIHNLRILGLSPDATLPEIRSSFRRLARTYHPDIAGRQGAHKFEQITGAYSFLKGLTPDELSQYTAKKTKPKTLLKKKDETWANPLAWHKRRRERLLAEEERTRRAAQEAQEKFQSARCARIDSILSRGERSVESLLSLIEEKIQDCSIQDSILRLSSGIPEVRHIALSRLGPNVNQHELLDAVITLLQKWDVDDKTARLVCTLPFTPENHRKLMKKLAARAGALPDFLLTHLLGLRTSQEPNIEILERYIQTANSTGAAIILRHWPKGGFVSAATLRLLLSREDEIVLIPLLSTMKQRSVPCPPWGYEHLRRLSSHSNVAVRVWAKALLPQSRV